MKNTENKGGNEAIASLPPSTESAIELKNITKRFGHVVANSNVNLKVRTQVLSMELLERMVLENQL